MKLAILLDIPSVFRSETIYTIENLFFPFQGEVVFVHNLVALKQYRNKLIYCHERSSFFSDVSIPKNTLFVQLENRTLSYFSSFEPYNIKEIILLNNTPCIFPLQQRKRIPNDGYIYPFDIIAASFFFLSCWQEYYIHERDWKGRVPLKNTLQHKLGIYRFPIVNQYLEQFNEDVQSLWGERFQKKPMPGASSLYVALSHDVDYIDWPLRKYLKKSVPHIRKKMIWTGKNLLSIVRNMFGRKYIFDAIHSIEKKYMASSTYFVLSDYHIPKHKRYLINMIQSLDSYPFEIGHHISDKSIINKKLNKDLKAFHILVKHRCGSRVHTLRFDVHSLFSQLEYNRYLYDSSLLFPEDFGYRTGFTYPHFIFDPIAKRPFNVVAIPLNVMDGTLVDSKYLHLSDRFAEDELMSFLKTVAHFGGALTFLFHNNIFFYNTVSRLEMYDRLLNYFDKQKYCIGSIRELYLWRVDVTTQEHFSRNGTHIHKM